MEKRIAVVAAACMLCGALTAQVSVPHTEAEDVKHVMSHAYWEQWNEKMQKEIDADIDKYRKADATVEIPGLKPGTTVHIEQTKHKFYFGAHIFNFNQLGSEEANARYRELYGTLFNSATVSFYWRVFEDRPGRLRFATEYWDTEEYWNDCADPKYQFHWRRPSSDQVVDYLESRGCRIHGHPLIWGNRKWQHPDWIQEQLPQGEERKVLNRLMQEKATLKNYKDGDVFTSTYQKMSGQALSDSLPEFAKAITEQFRLRIERIAKHYEGRIDSWDVVNESTVDYKQGLFKNPTPLCKSAYGIMPGDYVYDAFQTAEKSFPDKVWLNINDYDQGQGYADWAKELLRRGCKIDVLGSQMHLFNPQQCLDLADGKKSGPTPEQVKRVMGTLSQAGLPIHLSEITITAPNNDERGQMIQAILTRNLYRLWFSTEKMNGITWWNVVDDCGAPGEPSVSGIFSRDMQPKPAFYALDELINNEWKTVLDVQTTEKGRVSFRGFKGHYVISWKDKKGRIKTQEIDVE